MSIQTLPQPVVPSAATIAEVCPDHLQYRELQGAVDTRFREIAFANDVTISFLFLVITSADTNAAGMRSSTVTENGWALNSLTRFWHSVTMEGVSLKYNRISHRCLAHFLGALRTFISRMAGFKFPSALVTRSAILSSQALSILLNTQLLPLDSTIERELCMILFEFAFLSQKSQPIRQTFLEHIVPTLRGVKEDRSQSSDFGPDLKV